MLLLARIQARFAGYYITMAVNGSKRLALIIGNSLYGEKFLNLDNPQNDARAIEKMLKSLGFAVDNPFSMNRTYHEMLSDIEKFTEHIHEDTTDIVFYYAGHGCSIRGEIYLIPIDGSSSTRTSFAEKSYIPLNWVIEPIAEKRSRGVPIICILDCCRADIGDSRWPRGDSAKEAGALSNVCIMYATANGHVAKDGNERINGVFTERLLMYMDTPLTLTEISIAIAKDLKEEDQKPCIISNMDCHYSFRPLANEPVNPLANATSSREAMSQEKVFWPKYEQNRRFVDRPTVFEILNNTIETHRECTLCGLGGMGKSQIALEYCYRNKDNYRYIFWIDADTEETLQNSFVDVARLLNLPVLASIKSTSPNDLVLHALKWLQSNNDWLLVYDNFDDCSLGDTSNLRRLQSRYFPMVKRGVILKTTRNEILESSGSTIKLDEMGMGDDTALKLLLRKDISVMDADPFALKIICELGYLPLAIDLAGACMEMENLEPARFLESFRENPAGYLNLEDIQSATGSTYGKTVMTVWAVSFNHIRRKDPLAASLLQSFAFLYPDNIPFDLFDRHAQRILGLPEAPSSRLLNAAINLLRNFSLVRRKVRSEHDDVGLSRDTLTIHRLVQTVSLLKMELSEKLQWCERFVSTLCHAMPPQPKPLDERSQMTMEVYVQHAHHVSQQFGRWSKWKANSKELTSLLSSTIIYLTRHVLLEDVENLAKLAVSSSQAANGPKHSDTATALSNLSYFYASQRNFKAAEQHCKQAHNIRKSLLGFNNEDTEASLNDLALIYGHLNMEENATRLYLEAAQGGNTMAQIELAHRYNCGIGVARDYDAAFHWLLKYEVTKLPAHTGAQMASQFRNDSRIDLTPLHHAVKQNDMNGIRNRRTAYIQYANVGDKNNHTPLHCAVGDGNISLAGLLVAELGANVNAKDNDGWSPLHWAARNGNVDIMRLLVVEFKVDPNIRNNNFATPLHLAAQNGHSKFVDLLVRECGADVSAATDDGQTPLHLAAANGHLDVGRLLAKTLGAIVDINNKAGRTPLHGASENGHIDMVRLLLRELGSDVNAKTRYGRTPLLMAAENGHVEIVRSLAVEFCADVKAKTKGRWQALHWLARDGHAEVVEILVSKFEANVNATTNDGRTPLHEAAENGHVELVLLLVTKFGADTNTRIKNGRTLLHLAAKNGKVEMVKLLSRVYGADVNVKDIWGGTALHIAAENDHVEVMRYLVLKFAADVNAKNNDGITPLHWAASNGNVEAVKLLVVEGRANANVKDNNNATPLEWAARYGGIEVVKLLLTEFGVKANAKDKDGWTPLHAAAEGGYVETIKLLVKFGANTTVMSNNHETVLHRAAENGQIEAAKLLVMELRANVLAKNKYGQTPLHLAAEMGQIEVVKLMINLNSKDKKPAKTLRRAVEVVKLLLANDKTKTDVENNDGLMALYGTDQYGHFEVVNTKAINGQTALHGAARNGHVDVVRLLVVNGGADPNSKDFRYRTPLDHAIENGHFEVLRFLVLESGANLDVKFTKNLRMLRMAAKNGDVDIVKWVLAKLEADGNIGKIRVDTALHDAAESGHIEVVRLLVVNGRADPNTVDEKNRTPLYMATAEGHIEVMRTLVIEFRANTDVKTTDGLTVLQKAADDRNNDAVKLLIDELGADANVKDSNGWTPLQSAIAKGEMDVMKLLAARTILRELNFCGSKIGKKVLITLAEFLKLSITLIKLNLEDNFIGSKGAQALAESLRHNITLTHLGLRRGSIGSEGAQALAESLKKNTTLIQLNLNINNIDSEGAQALAKSLKQNTTLTQLDLSRNSIGSVAVQALAEALNQNTTLTQLNLRSNDIDSEGAQALAESLKQNTTLTQLDLSWNNIFSEGAQALAESLNQNTTLTQLNLRWNNIGSKGAQALAGSLRQNITLTHLSLSRNNICSEGAQALAESLKQNITLTYMDLNDNFIGSIGAKALAECLKKNTTLTQLNLEGNDLSYSAHSLVTGLLSLHRSEI